MPNAAIHPTPQELSAFSLGKLADAASAAVARHLENCPECRKALDSLPGDSFLSKVRAAKPGISSLPVRPLRAGKAANVPANAAAPSAPPKDLPPDLAHYGKYRFLRELGRGGMGVVYQAEQTVMGRTVAVKVINPRVLDHPTALPRFQAEVRAAAKLDHDNIVRAYDAEQVGSMHLLVMEYVEGTSLADLVKKKGPLPVAYACHYIRQAALGLQHAFEQGMVHRDIKPQNLMVNPRGQVKVLDFGLARMFSERKQGCGLTQTDAFMGTPEYVAPEQATDARSADTRADIYSLGCTLFFLLTGRPPFQEVSMVKMVLAQIEKEPPVLHEVRADVPAELSAVVARMLAKDPARRFQTPIEVEQALAVFVKPGTKRLVAGVSPPALGVSSPRIGTVIAADTSKIKAILREAPGTTSAPAAPAVDAAASAFAGLAEAVVSARKAKPARKKWWIAGGVAVSLLLLGLGTAGVFKVKTKDGILVIEVNEPNPDVYMDGEKVTLSWGNGGKKTEIRIKAGTRKVQVKKEGFTMFGEVVTLEEGKRRILVARLDKTMPPDAPGGDTKKSPTPPTRLAPLPPSAALEALRRDNIPLEALVLAGDGDAKRAPASLVGVLGEVQPFHTDAVWSLAYSPDGHLLASGSFDRTIMLRDTATGRVKRILTGHTAAVVAVGFSKDGRTLVSASHDGTLRLWSVDKNEKPTIVDVEAKLGHPVIWAMAVSPDGRFVAAAGNSGLIKLWKWGAWEKPIEIADLRGKGLIRALAFSPDGELLACGGGEEKEDARVRIYTTADGKQKNLPNNTTRVTGLSFSHDGKYLAAVRLAALKLPGGDGRVWEVATGKEVAKLTRPTFPGEWNDSGCVAWSPDDKTLAVGTFWRVIVYDFPTGARRTLCCGLDEGVSSVSFSPHGDMLAAGGSRADIPVWDTASWKLKYLERGHPREVRSVAVSPDGREVLSLGNEMAVLRWQLARPEKAVVHHLDFASSDNQPFRFSVSYSHDGKTYVTPSHHLIAVRNTVTEKETVIRTLPMGLDTPAVSPDGRIVAAGEGDGYLHLWDLALGRDVHRFPTKGRWCGLAFSRDGVFLASCNAATKRVVIWNAATGAEGCSWEVKSLASTSAFHPQGKTLATGHEDGSILLWDTATGQKRIALGGHSGRVRALKFTPDGKTLVSSGDDGIIRLWHPEHPRAREIIPLGPANRPLTFDLDPSGKYLFAAGHAPVIFILRLP